MQIFRASYDWPETLRGAVLALGNFDGLHLGHRAVIEAALKIGKAKNRPVGIMSFEPHPRGVLRPGSAPPRLLPLHAKLRTLQETGIDFCILQRFTSAFSQLSAQAFIEELLIKKLRIAHLVTGDNFVFGKARSGNPPLLQHYAEKGAFAYTPVTGLIMEEGFCSSTRIRDALKSSHPELAARLLGRPYEITGRVIKGAQRGRILGYPTANIAIRQSIIPALGIYAVRWCECGSEGWKTGVASIGVNPTFGTLPEPRLELHAFDDPGNLYDKRLRVQLISYLRPEQQFKNESELKLAIGRDCEDAKTLLIRYNEII